MYLRNKYVSLYVVCKYLCVYVFCMDVCKHFYLHRPVCFFQVRQNHGTDIAGACGQLALSSTEKKGAVGDIEDLMSQKRRGGEGKKQQESSSSSTSNSKGAHEDEGLLLLKGMPSIVNCSRFTWILSLASTVIIVIAVITLKAGFVEYVLKDEMD